MKWYMCFGLLLLAGCATVPVEESSPPQGTKPSFNDEMCQLAEQRINLYEKYNEMMPSIVIDLKRCSPIQTASAEEMAKFANHVVEYGADLETRGFDDMDLMTVQNQKYWEAVLTLSAGDVTALFTRLLLLMREGELRRAKIVLLFCAYDQNTAWERDSQIMESVSRDIATVEKASNQLIQTGIKHWDAGERDKAVEMYRRAMEIFPKNPWALWELGYDHMTYDPEPDEIIDGRFDSFYGLIREIDPHYQIAYCQGTNSSEKWAKLRALQEKVLPSYNRLRNCEEPIASMRLLADGYFEMKEYEYALYAYKYLLFHPDNTGFDDEIIYQIHRCLEKLGVPQVSAYLDEWVSFLESRF